HDLVDETDGQSPFGMDEAAGHHQFGRDCHADKPGQEIADAHIAGREAELDESGIHFDAFAANPDVGGERKGEAASAGCALDQGDDGLRAAAHLDVDVGEVALETEATAKWRFIVFAARLDIEAGAESTA